jgi:hypothetical protein
MKITFFTLVLMIPLTCFAQTEIPSSEWQIKTAVLAVDEKDRDGAKVYGYNASSELIVLREGSNQYICLADDPNKKGFQCASYHKDLDPFMQRGRDLKAQGKESQEIFDIREKEVYSGDLFMPSRANLTVLRGTVNEETKEIENTKVRYVVYIPYATPESTGIPAKPIAAGHPWIMDPGTHRAHIMISPVYED